MVPTHVTLRIRVEGPQGGVVLLENVSLDEPVAAVIQQALVKLGRPPSPEGWGLEYQGLPLPANLPLHKCLGAYSGAVELTLRPVAARPPVAGPQARPPSAPAPLPPLGQRGDEDFDDLESSSEAMALDEVAFDDDAGVDDDAMAAPAPRARAGRGELMPGRSAAPATRNATVRYYSQMNPERVFPLLVVLTKGMTEKVKKKGVAQRSTGPFEVDEEEPVEVEPILPGCQVYPPRITTRLGDDDVTLSFRVVPHVTGRLDGAAVVIRQDHAALAEVGLEIKVVERTWVVFSGAMTFLLPALSAVMKHFGLDFDTQRQQGYDLYLAAARLVFDQASPLVLTGALGALTGLLWWLTRPKARDVFHEVKNVSAEEKLDEVRRAMARDPAGASQALLEALKAFPNHQPTRLFYAEWHYDLENYKAALKGYLKALRLGPAEADDYLKASLSASRLGENDTAVEILDMAEKALGPGGMPGVLLFNKACYHTRLGDYTAAIVALRRAVAAGFRKKESYLNDPDLAPLRARADYKQIVASL